ncbi:hypothetical protein [Bacillus phage Megatron]|uniref:Uncharacterized protein n=4 Tax=Wphvirus TaxID=1922327 RepID=A0A024B1X3_9CAUD|nr:hypothetical protein FP75_gp047 [Bacillus phage Megatron]YP_009279218.1 hypothetical protein BIZ89_gp051 [Bacillus phage Kida]YP_009280855.1 hypothetical protein SAGEFAYGE_52 [Bacillus phage SageFayge]YP_009284378.1 hypothetical protein BI004_gp050 [Bacillus phage NotTheCreek]ANI24668.1 hypothetical protein SMUDGE_49 [Bacillus phage Smudge]ASR78290.1 hypothetical protein PPISBEST_52 [Bacillus phage PPIsBest]ASR79265.1 hypothetical protein ZAINNY_52 [Bacillus phage Zainny]AUV57689.1 hypoth
MGRLLYTISDAIGTISIFLMVTEGFSWTYLIALLTSGVISAFLPYEVRRVEY